MFLNLDRGGWPLDEFLNLSNKQTTCFFGQKGGDQTSLDLESVVNLFLLSRWYGLNI